MKWAECIRMNGRWTKSQWLTRFLTVLCNAFATLYAVAASEFDLTDQLYDLIIRLSAQKPACKCCTYWAERARHYSIAVMTRVAAVQERTGRSPGTLRARHYETPSERFDRQFADGGVESDSTGDHESVAVASKVRCYKI
jgi:hypothetical protein